jgi:ELWxxDGT repeat protein
VSDGTAAGTRLLADIRTGSAASAPGSFTAMADGRVAFAATTDRYGREPWVTDGTAAGTMLLADVNTAPRGLPGVVSFTDFGAGKLYFYSGTTSALTWATDGTVGGTQLMRSTAAPDGFLITGGVVPSGTAGSFIFLTRVNNVDYIARGDGSLTGTSIIAAPVTAPSGIVSLPGGRALTVGTVDGAAASLVVTDGTLAGTAKLGVLSFQGGALVEGQSISKVVNGYRYFAAVGDATGNELWRTDGTQAGTTLVADVDPRVPGSFFGSAPSGFTTAGDLVYFIAHAIVLTSGSINPQALWRTDGTAAGTIDLTGGIGSKFSGIRAMEGFGSSLLYETYGFSSSGGTTVNFKYSITDGSGLGSSTLLYTVPVANGFSNGTPNGAAIRQISPGHALIAGDYSGLNPNVLLGTDGTAAGTGPLGSFTQLSNASGPAGTPYYAVLGNGQALFIANNGTTGLELWHTDGTPAGTALVADATPGAGSTVFGRISILDNGTAAFAQVAGGVRSIIISDGSTAGTSRFLTLSGSGTALPDEFHRLPDGRLVYRFDDGVNGTQPWVSDGTAAGTKPLYDPTITADSNPTGFAEVSFTGDQSFVGTEGPDRLHPGNWNDTVQGLGGDDILFQGIGDNIFDGGTGFDRLDATVMGFRGATLSRSGGDTILSQSGQTDRLRGVEEVDLADGRLVFDATDPAAQVTRLYQAALARLPDQVGLNFWTGQLQAGGPLTDIAHGFFASNEFINRFGAGLSNTQYVDQLYQNVLGRAGEPEGRQGWIDFLGRGASREQVLVGFSESPENQARTQPLVDAGIWDLSENAGRVARLYDAIMGRLPDVAGMNTWRAALDGGATLIDVTRGFTGSTEFATRYGNPDNATFVTLLYRNTLEREPDAGGLAFWTGQLDHGVSRAEVIIGFSESAEEITLTKGAIMNEAAGSFGILFA